MEKSLIQWLQQQFGATRFATVGIGDDCAVLPRTDREWVVTCDAICEGVHFHSSQLSLQDIGRKALAINLSDLASMGAHAKTALFSLALPRSSHLDDAKKLFTGMAALAAKYDVEIVGGDTVTWDQGLVISITAMGTAPSTGAWLISNAKPGDQILVTGDLGGSILSQHALFEPRLAFAQQWSEADGIIRACTDISDSLGVDLTKMAKASGVGFEIDLQSVPIAADAYVLAKTSQRTALQHAISDGEDFELIIVVAPEAVDKILSETKDIPLTRIGEFTESTEWLAKRAGVSEVFQPVGYEHSMGDESE